MLEDPAGLLDHLSWAGENREKRGRGDNKGCDKQVLVPGAARGNGCNRVKSSKRKSRAAQVREAKEAHRVNPDQRLTAEEVLEVVFGLALEECDLWE